MYIPLTQTAFSHYLCQAEITEKEALNLFATSKSLWYSPMAAERHADCHLYILYKNPIKVDLALLGCCRQLYQEARLTLFSANTWSFRCPEEVLQFWTAGIRLGVPPKINSFIRRLSLEIAVFDRL